MSKRTKYIVKDWADNEMFNGKLFNSFEDAWDFIYSHIEDEDDYQELNVREI